MLSIGMNQCCYEVPALVGFDLNVVRYLDALLDALMVIPLCWICDMSIFRVGIHAKTFGR